MRCISTFILAILATCLLSLNGSAAIYTTVKSGNYSDPTVWQGGIAPPASIGNNQVYITSGVIVQMDDDIVVGPQSTLQLQSGNLIDSGKHILTFNNPDSFYASNAVIYANKIYMPTGNYNAPQTTIATRFLEFAGARITGKVQLKAELHLLFTGDTTYIDDGTFEFMYRPDPNDSSTYAQKRIVFDNGILSTSSNIQNNSIYEYLIWYKDSINTVGGFEMDGNAIYDVQVYSGLPDTTRVLMGTDVYIPRELKVLNCDLDLNGHTLTIGSDGYFIGSAVFPPNFYLGRAIGSRTSSLVLNNRTKVPFKPGTDTLKKLEINFSNTSPTPPSGGNDSIRLYIVDSLVLKSGIFEADITMGPRSVTMGGSINSFVWGRITTQIAGYGSYFYPIGYVGSDIGGAQKDQPYYAPVRIISNTPDPVYITLSADPEILSLSQLNINNIRLRNFWQVNIPQSSTYDIDVEPFWSSNMEVNSFDRNASVFTTGTSGQALVQYNSQAAQINPNGMYSIAQRNVTDLQDYFTLLDTTNSSSSINSISTHNTIALHPNPATDILTISNKEHSSVTAIMQDVTGKVVRTITLQRGENIIDVNDLAGGMYMVTFKNTNMQTTKKFVKQ